MENMKKQKIPVCYEDWDNSDLEDQDIMEKEEMHDAEYGVKNDENIDNLPTKTIYNVFDIVLKEFDMSIFTDTHQIIIVGRRGKGKTHLITEILKLQEIRNENMTIISCINEELVKYSDKFNGAVLHNEYNKTFIKDAIYRCTILYKNVIRKQYEIPSVSKRSLQPGTAVGGSEDDRATKTGSTIVFDNCFYDNTWYSNKCIKQLFMNGKVWRINTIISFNYPIGIPPVLRCNIDCFFIFNDSDYSYRKRIWEMYVFEFLPLEMFNHIMLQLINPYECLVVKPSYKSKKIEDNIFVILLPNNTGC